MSRRSRGSRKQLAETVNSEPTTEQGHRTYSDEFIYTALASVKLCGGNVRRAAIACDVPYSTLRGWVEEAEAEESRFNENPHGFRLKEKLGDIAAKMEDKLHAVVESVTPDVIRKASLSQRGVFAGIMFDKVRAARGQGLEPDPLAELARMLGMNRNQFPETLELQPGEALPKGFLGPVIDLEPKPDGSFGVTCEDCGDSGMLKSATGKTIPCPFCRQQSRFDLPPEPLSQEPIDAVNAPAGPIDSIGPSDTISRSYACSNSLDCQYSITSDVDLRNSRCPACVTGTLQPSDVSGRSLLDSIKDEDSEN